MRKWYAFLSGKKMLGIGLGAVVALTALLAVNFYREQNDRYVTTIYLNLPGYTETELHVVLMP